MSHHHSRAWSSPGCEQKGPYNGARRDASLAPRPAALFAPAKSSTGPATILVWHHEANERRF